MSAYVITDAEITDASLYGQFLEPVTATVESHGGRFLTHGQGLEVIEGDWMPKRIATLEFDNTALDEIRTKSSNINIAVVEGL